MLTLALIGLVGGLITGISPCVLPVLPVIFLSGGAASAREDATAKAFTGWRPYLVILGLVLSFSIFTLVGSLLLTLLNFPQDFLRWAGLIVLVLLGIGLIVPRIGHLLERPFSRIPQREVSTGRSGFLLGLALGAVYVPCAGPVLAAITVAGATGQIGPDTIVLTASFAIGTAIPLLAFALAGRRVAERVATFRRHQGRVRVIAGITMIALAIGITFNLPELLQRLIPDYTSALQEAAGGEEVLGTDGTAGDGVSYCAEGVETLVDCGAAPPITGIAEWLNTEAGRALDLNELRGRVVLIDFWAYSCINCQRASPHLVAWHEAYADAGLQIIGVHSPEYAFERVTRNVVAGAERLGIEYAVALDNDFATWTNYNNRYWPAEYLIDANGIVRHIKFGEGDYQTTERLIRELLTDADPAVSLPAATEVADQTPNSRQTPELYLGVLRASQTNYGGIGDFVAGTGRFGFRDELCENCFAFDGEWTIDDEGVTSNGTGQVRLDYEADHVYLNVEGEGTLTVRDGDGTRRIDVSGEPNIYDLLEPGASGRAELTVTLSPGLKAYSFTFGTD